MIIGFISSVITTRQFMKYCSAVNCCCAAVFDEDKNWKLFENSELKIIWLWWCCNYDHPVIASHSQHSVFRKIWLKLFSPNNFKTYSSYFQEYSFIDGFVGSDYIYIHFSKYFSKLKIVLPLFDCWDQCETCDLCWLTPTRATSWLAVTITVCSGPSLWPSLELGSGAALCRLVHQSNTVLSRDQSRVSHGSEWWWPGSHQVNLCSSQLYVGCITALDNWCWFTFLCSLSPLDYSQSYDTVKQQQQHLVKYHWRHLVSTVSIVSCTEEVWMSCW